MKSFVHCLSCDSHTTKHSDIPPEPPKIHYCECHESLHDLSSRAPSVIMALIIPAIYNASTMIKLISLI